MRVTRALSTQAALGAAAALLLAGAACSSSGDSIEGLAQGISRDSVITVLAGGTRPADGNPPHVVETTQFLNAGVLYEVLYYAPEAPAGATAAQVERDDVTPIVITNGVLAGYGWDHMNMVAGQTKAQIPAFRADD